MNATTAAALVPLLPFEALSVLLLSALVGAIVLSRRRSSGGTGSGGTGSGGRRPAGRTADGTAPSRTAPAPPEQER